MELCQACEPVGCRLGHPVWVGEDPGEGDRLGVVDHRDQWVELGDPVSAGVEEVGEAAVAVCGPVVALGPPVQDVSCVSVGRLGGVVPPVLLVHECGMTALCAENLGDRSQVVFLLRPVRSW